MSEKKSAKKGCLIAAIVIVVITILGFGGCALLVGGVANEVSNTMAAEELEIANAPVSEIPWSELNEVYHLKSTKTDLQKDEIWKKYKGKKIQWTGEVSSISETFGSLQLQVKMNKSTFTSDVIVTLKDSDRSKAVSLSEGDSVTFQAILSSWGSLMPITLNKGIIIE